MTEVSHAVGYREVFRSLPLPALLLDTDLRVVDANAAYLGALGRSLEEMVGGYVFDVFPAETPGSGRTLESSLRRVLASGRRDHLPLLEYGIEADRGNGFFERRWWSITNEPVLDAEGRVQLILNTVDEVTDVIHERERSRLALDEAGSLRVRAEALEKDLSRRSKELYATAEAERATSVRLAGLAETALDLTAAESVEALLDVVISRGLLALGADGGAVAVIDAAGESLHLIISESLGVQAQRDYAELPLSGMLPACIAARTGEIVLLPDAAAGLALTPEMGPVQEATGKEAWASLPLQAGGVILGSLTASWVEPREFSDDDVRLMDALAAQCGQTLYRLLQRDAERAAVAETRELAVALQRSLLTEPPQPDHLQIAVRYLPAARDLEIGGDWYDAFLVGGTTSLVVADVMGHDRDAAAAMGQLRGLLRGVAHANRESPAAVLSGLDAAMADLSVDNLTTGVLAQIEQGRREAEQDMRLLRWSNAGHPPPLLMQTDGTAKYLERPADLLLGLDPAAERHDHTHLLPPGSTVLFYTDGLIERRGQDLAEGYAWLAAAASELIERPLEELCDLLLGELEGVVEDDVALLALRLFTESRPRPAEAGPGDDPEDSAEVHDVPEPANNAAVPAPRDGGSPSESSVMLPCDPAAVRRGRKFVEAFCHRQHLTDDICETAVLLASEVVTNAILHGRSDVRLALRPAAPDGIRIEVGDANSRHPARAATDGEALDGRGIAIVELLARDWGVRDEPPGKVVWFEIAAA